jgi:uncharacterized protein
VTAAAPDAGRRWPALELLAGALIAVALVRNAWPDAFDRPALQTWTTIFVAICVQAVPFLVLGVAISGAIAALVPSEVFARVVPQRAALAVPAAGLAGLALPGCECGSVPIAGRLVARGVTPAAALTFLLAAPAVNPVVLVATAVAFPGQPRFVLARFVASMLTAWVVGWCWIRVGQDAWVDRARRRGVHTEGGRFAVFRATVQHDFLHAGGYLVVGGITAATLNVVVPRSVLDGAARNTVLAIVALSLLAVVMAICSEADAFVAASLTQFPLTARLAFLVVGPAVDIKLVALQVGTFGRAFAWRFAPLTWGVALASSALIGWWLL